MQNRVQEILIKESYSKSELVQLLSLDQTEQQALFEKGHETKKEFVELRTYFRGLIELSNICTKNCYYCGIRSGNKKLIKYELTDNEVLESIKFAHEQKYASIVIQAGERNDLKFINRITSLVEKAKMLTSGEIGITLSLGEQDPSTYKTWFDAGAHRYLLRIETSNKDLYYKIHPKNNKHKFERRMQALHDLKEIGYQTGTGVMIGLPYQTIEDLADDLLFFKRFDIDMAGMGPYIEHQDTPLYSVREKLLPLSERFYLSLKMVSILRIMMKDINIAATTAMQAIDPLGREKAIKAGANVMMPNITPTLNRSNYLLYENKPCLDESAEECASCIEARISIAGDSIAYGEWGDSPHFRNRKGDKTGGLS
jgi:biotin synthase